MSQSRPRELAALTAVGVGVCCGLPLLLGAGAVGAVAGIALGSTVAVAACALAVAVGVRRWRRRQARGTEYAIDRDSAPPPGGC